MAITIEQLDDDAKNNDITILVRKDLILKFVPGRSVLDSEEALQKLIKIHNLLSSDILDKTKELVKLSEEISQGLSRSIELQENFAKHKIFRPIIIKQFEKIKKNITKKGKRVKKLEEEIGLFLAKDYHLHFCPKCKSYQADSPESLPLNCKFCGQKMKWGKPFIFTRFLDTKTTAYLHGLWLEDYIAKLLRVKGWRTWCHGLVMGSSGIYHPIDVLAINPKDGLVLVAECKSGAIKGKDIFNFSAQYLDIKSNYGFCFSLKELSDPRGRDYMKKTPGLYLLDNLEGLSDEEIIKKISEHLVQ